MSWKVTTVGRQMNSGLTELIMHLDEMTMDGWELVSSEQLVRYRNETMRDHFFYWRKAD
jgi:hypothetical protein